MPSVGRVADSYDNAMAEALNGAFKAELIDRCAPIEYEHIHYSQRTTLAPTGAR
jgi:putative transposase